MRSFVLFVVFGLSACKPSAQSSPDLATSASAAPMIASAQTASVDAAIASVATTIAPASSSAAAKSNLPKPHNDNAQSAAEKRQLEKLDALNRPSAVQSALNRGDVPPADLTGASSATPQH
jgi:hypothetical protein